MIGALINESIPARDEYLNINATKTHIDITILPIIGEITMIVPMVVAIPLPPLNFNHNGKL